MLVNGKQQKLISIRDRGLLYGDGVFRTLLSSQGQALHWPLHYQKIQHDCAALGITCPGIAVLSAELNELLLQHPDAVLKLIVTRGQGRRGYTPFTDTKPTHIWDVSERPELPPDASTFGVKVRWCQLRLGTQPRLAGVKHLNRLENVLAAEEVSEEGAKEGLLMDAADNVISGTRSNLFLVHGGALITPDLSSCGVSGVQRDRVFDWAAQHKIAVQVRDISQNEVLGADELFLVNSVIGLWPIGELGDQKLNGQKWSTFPVSMRIRRDLLVQGE
ncbi:MAG: aminodeoxychorismate lyase [Gallionella sp.]